MEVISSTVLGDIPYEVLGLILSFLSPEDRAELRSVCRVWNKKLEEIGIFLQVDEDDEQSVQLLKTKRLSKILFLNYEHPQETLRYPLDVEEIQCFGIMDPKWFKSSLLGACQYLSQLHLYGHFFHQLDLTGEGAVFPNLEVLEALRIKLGFGDIVDIYDLRKLIVGEMLEPTLDKLDLFDRNLSLILDRIRSKKLRFLELCNGIEVVREPPEHYQFNWRFEPLESFLEYHRETLKQLELPNFMGKGTCDHDVHRVLPKKLTKLRLRHQEMWFQCDAYWKDLIFYQKNLTDVFVRLIDHSGSMITDVACSLGTRNPNLKYFTLRFGKGTAHSLEEELFSEPNCIYLTFDARWFSNCLKLDSFILICEQKEEVSSYIPTLENFSSLPSSLRRIVIDSVIVNGMLVDDIVGFPNLEELSLGNVFLSGTSVVEQHQLWCSLLNIRPFLAQCIRHRKLHFLCIRFWKCPPISRNLKLFLEYVTNLNLSGHRCLRCFHIGPTDMVWSCQCQDILGPMQKYDYRFKSHNDLLELDESVNVADELEHIREQNSIFLDSGVSDNHRSFLSQAPSLELNQVVCMVNSNLSKNNAPSQQPSPSSSESQESLRSQIVDDC